MFNSERSVSLKEESTRAVMIVIMSLGLITKTDVNKLKEAWYALIDVDKHESILERWNAECARAGKLKENTSPKEEIKEIIWQWMLVGRLPNGSIDVDDVKKEKPTGNDSFLRKMRKGGEIDNVAYEAFGQYFNNGVNVDREAFYAGFMKMAEFDEVTTAHVIKVAEFLRSRPDVKIWIPSHSNFEHIGYILEKFKELGVDDVFTPHFNIDSRELHKADGKAAFMLSPFLEEPDLHSEMMLEMLASRKVDLPPGSRVMSLLDSIKPNTTVRGGTTVEDFFKEKECQFTYTKLGTEFKELFDLPPAAEVSSEKAAETLNVSQAMFGRASDTNPNVTSDNMSSGPHAV